MKRFKNSTLVSSLLLFTFFIIMQATTWIPLRFWKIWSGVNYFDLNLVLNWSDCYKKYGNLIFANSSDASGCSGYIYGSSLIRALAYFGIDSKYTVLVGSLFIFLLSLSISLVTRRGAGGGTFQFPNIIIVLSPPVILIAELGNFDILILLLVLCASLLLSNNYHYPALLLVTLSSVMKFYTIPIFALLFLFSKNRVQKVMTILVGLLVIIRVVMDLKLIKSNFPSGFYEQFGASIWPRYLENSHFHGLGNRINLIIGIVIFIMLYLLILNLIKKHKLSMDLFVTGNEKERLLFYFLFGTHLACYFAGMNFDHRLIFFALSSIIFIKSLSKRGSLLFKMIILLVIVALWLTYPGPGLEPIGDLALEVATVIMAIRFVGLLKMDLERKRT